MGILGKPATKLLPKRLIICCDGTWQSSATAKPNIPSNVTQICRSVARSGRTEDGRVIPQIVYYDAGIGTGDISLIERNRQGSIGCGLNVNVIEAYNFLVNNYDEGDELFFFGFSRGAYTVRAVAGLVCEIGIMKPIEMRLFPQIYAAHKRAIGNEAVMSVERWWGKNLPDLEYRTPRADVPIKAIGVWDTVAALGLPKERKVRDDRYKRQYLFHKTNIHPRIENAFQALALDERRGPFTPVLWWLPKDNTITNLLQVWFPGVHINVGGGDSDALLKKYKGDHEALAHITFAWMVDRVSDFLTFDLESIDFALHSSDPGPVALSLGVKQKIRYAGGYIKDGWAQFIYLFLGTKDRTPGEYKEVATLPKLLTDLGLTNEEVHPSVYCCQVGAMSDALGDLNEHVLRKKKYIPRGLVDFERIQGEKGWCWYRFEGHHGKACGAFSTGLKPELKLPEFVIPHRLGTKPSVERLLMEDQTNSKRLLRELDAGNGLSVSPEEE